MKAQQETLWMNKFAMILLRYIPPTHPVWSPALNAYYKEIIEKQITDDMQELEQKKKLLSDIDLRFRPIEKPEGYREPLVLRET